MGILSKKKNVTDGAQVPHAQEEQPHSKVATNNKMSVFIICLLLAALVVAGGATIYLLGKKKPEDNRPKTPQLSTVCSEGKDSLTTEAVKAMKSNNPEDLKKVAEKVEKLQDYKNDPNCEYILTVYYTNRGDSRRAREHSTQLKTISASNKSIDPSLIAQSGKLEEVEKRVQFIEKQSSQESDFIGVEDPNSGGNQQ